MSVVSEKSIIFASTEKRMLEEKALRGEDLIVSSDGKTIERIPARQYLPQ